MPKELKEAGISKDELRFELYGGESAAGEYILTPEATKKLI